MQAVSTTFHSLFVQPRIFLACSLQTPKFLRLVNKHKPAIAVRGPQRSVGRKGNEAHRVAKLRYPCAHATGGATSDPNIAQTGLEEGQAQVLQEVQLVSTSGQAEPNAGSEPLKRLRSFWNHHQAQAQELAVKLKSFGSAGVLAYGLFNTVYYLTSFLFVWLYVAPSPGGLGYRAAAERFVRIFTTVWAGSQVTKLLRAGGALMLAPVVDRGLTWTTERFGLRSRDQTFSLLVGACFGLALVTFAAITSMWA